MASKSKSIDKTNNVNKTHVVDRKAVQQQGQQILDSIVVSNDDRVIKSTLAEARVMLDGLTNANSITVSKMSSVVDRVLSYVNKNQVGINSFALQSLERARADLRELAASGEMVIKLSSDTVGRAMTMAQDVADSQAKNQALALEILADTKTGDYQDVLKTVTGMVLAFSLVALLIVRK